MGVLLDSTCWEVFGFLLILLSFLFYRYATSTFDYWKERGVAYIKPVPFFGNTWAMTSLKKSPAEIFKDLYFSKEFENEKFGGVFLSRRPTLLAKDPDLIKQIMIKDFQYFSDRGLVFNEKIDPLNAHLFNLSGWRWRALRTKLTPTFTSGKMKMMFGLMAECANGLENLLAEPAKNEEILEVKEYLAKFSTDVIGTTAFGLQINALSNPDSEFRKMGRQIFKTSLLSAIKRSLWVALPFIRKYIRISVVPKEASDFFLNVVKDTVHYREQNSVTRNDFLQLLIEIKNKGTIADDEDKNKTAHIIPTDENDKQVLELTDDLLAAQAFIFFIAGFETASTTMSFALYELALNPDIQDKLAEEIRDSISEHDDKITYDSLQEMKYLDKVVSETLRKYPPTGNLFRQCTKQYKIPGTNVVLDKQSRVFISVHAIHRDPKYYPNPDKFDPERFTPEEKAKRHPMTYMPFGEGPRMCIGSRFGLLEVKLGLATLLKRYRFEVCDRTIIPPKFDPRAFTASLKGGVWLRIKER